VAQGRRRRARGAPALLIAATDSPPGFREPNEVLADALPRPAARSSAAANLIDPAAPEVLKFSEEVLKSR
jgi:hypothetical protein